MKIIALPLSFLFLAANTYAETSLRTDFFFPQVPDGVMSRFPDGTVSQELRTILIFTNPNDGLARGTLALFDERGAPLASKFRDRVGNTLVGPVIKFQVPARGAFKITSDGTHNLVEGYARVNADVPISGMAVFQEFAISRESGEVIRKVVREADVEGVGILRVFSIGFPDSLEDERTDTGLAIVNASTASANVTLNFLSADGILAERVAITLLPGEHRSFFVSKILPPVLRPRPSIVSLIAESSADISVVGLRLGANSFASTPIGQIR